MQRLVSLQGVDRYEGDPPVVHGHVERISEFCDGAEVVGAFLRRIKPRKSGKGTLDGLRFIPDTEHFAINDSSTVPQHKRTSKH